MFKVIVENLYEIVQEERKLLCGHLWKKTM